jgi:hypothetical protein
LKRSLRGNTLAATLVVAVIILAATVVLMTGKGGAEPKMKADGRGKTVLGNAKATAEDSVCVSNLSQVRQLIQVAQATDEEFRPSTVAEIPGATSVGKCPVGKETYNLDPTNLNVSCPHLGHEKY